jgi:putative transposase
MGRPLRASEGGYVYHVLNRANARLPLFHKDGDYAAFHRVLAEACAYVPMRVLSWCVMPNHWHLVLWPEADGALSHFMAWLTLTHTQRWHAHYHNTGTGHLYQGRFKSFPVQEDEHLLTVCRYVEWNALRAGLVTRAEDWRWCSLWQRLHGTASAQTVLREWPVPCPSSWLEEVNAAQTLGELEALRRCVRRGQPFGEDTWVETTVKRLRLERTMRPQGRPRKTQPAGENGS